VLIEGEEVSTFFEDQETFFLHFTSVRLFSSLQEMPSLRSLRRRRSIVSRFLLLLLALSLFLISTQPRWQPLTISSDLDNATSVLWVIAHRMSRSCVSVQSASLIKSSFLSAFSLLPFSLFTADDESFFFAPSILNLLDERRGVQGSLLCLSIGKSP